MKTTEKIGAVIDHALAFNLPATLRDARDALQVANRDDAQDFAFVRITLGRYARRVEARRLTPGQTAIVEALASARGLGHVIGRGDPPIGFAFVGECERCNAALSVRDNSGGCEGSGTALAYECGRSEPKPSKRAHFTVAAVVIRCPLETCRAIFHTKGGEPTWYPAQILRVGAAVNECDECGHLFKFPTRLLTLAQESEEAARQ